MEALGQSYGFILYRKKLDGPVSGALKITEARDYAVVHLGDERVGALGQSSLTVNLSSGTQFDILVENMGRINFGSSMVTDRKGITGKITLGGKELRDWEIYPLPLTDLRRLKFSASAKIGPVFYRGVFKLTSLGDTYVDMRGWGKGCVWINGHNLGRYWRIGPQQSLFVPAAWLKKGRNEIIVLDLEQGQNRSVQGIKELVFETPQAE